MLKMMDEENILTFTNILNRMYRENFVPYDWNIGMITQIWKKKERKGDPANYRGIAVNSNVGKVMEKLMANRINENISLTEYQGGGKGGSACSEFLFIMESLMNKFRGKGLHIVFLDVEKAFDKAWREVIMWLMNERGCGNKEWIYLETLNSENKVRVNTVFGPTDEVNINRVIKQGAVLSPIQYAILIDEIARKLMEEDMGVILNDINLPCLLWVDDVMVPGESYDDIQTMVDKVYDIARKFKVEFGMDKTGHMILGEDPQPERHLLLGGKEIKKVDEYKYLGVIMDKHGGLSKHIAYARKKVFAAVDCIMNVTSAEILSKIEVEAIREMTGNTINAILAYGLEAFVIDDDSMKTIKDIQCKAIKEIFDLHSYVPDEIMLVDLGIYDIEWEIKKRKIGFYKRIIHNNEGDPCKKKISLEDAFNGNDLWREDISNIMRELDVDSGLIRKSKFSLNNHLQKKIKNIMIDRILTKSGLIPERESESNIAYSNERDSERLTERDSERLSERERDIINENSISERERTSSERDVTNEVSCEEERNNMHGSKRDERESRREISVSGIIPEKENESNIAYLNERDSEGLSERERNIINENSYSESERTSSNSERERTSNEVSCEEERTNMYESERNYGDSKKEIQVRKSKRIMEKGIRINYKDMANGTLDKEKKERYSKRVRYFADNVTNKGMNPIRFKADYVSRVNRSGVKFILEGRCKLFPCKKNFEYLNLKKGLLCRWCERECETEEHVLEKCDKSPFSNLMKREDFFSDDPITINKVKKSGILLYKEYNKRNMKW